MAAMRRYSSSTIRTPRTPYDTVAGLDGIAEDVGSITSDLFYYSARFVAGNEWRGIDDAHQQCPALEFRDG
jgi:hypothetical protein